MKDETPLGIALAVAALLFAGYMGGYYVTSQTVQASDDCVPLVKADPRPYKVRPQ